MNTGSHSVQLAWGLPDKFWAAGQSRFPQSGSKESHKCDYTAVIIYLVHCKLALKSQANP